MTGLKLIAFLAAVLAATANPVAVPSVDASCTITSYNQVDGVISSCTNIVINSLKVPAGKTLTLNLKSGSTLTFQGITTFDYSEWAGPLVIVKGNKVTIQGASGSVLDGQGPKWWDGKGDSGKKKPKFFRIQTTGGSMFKNIKLLNCPHQCVSINSAHDTTLSGWTLDVSAGNSKGGKNTDGFDLSSSSNILVENCVVKNQDDCVAVNQGSNYYFSKLACSGGHGLSLSVGQSSASGSPNTVKNVTFSDCTVSNSRNGIHVKTHTDAGTGSISDVVYKNIQLSGITNYGINVQEDYAKGKSTGSPKGNIPISNLIMSSVKGTMSGGSSSMPIYILCGKEGCKSWSWSGISISNGKKSNSCNFTPSGFKC